MKTEHPKKRRDIYVQFLKPSLDVIMASTVSMVLLPVGLIIALLLRLQSNGRIFFTQERPGKNGKIFRILKFKTMNDKKDSNGNLLPDEERITKIGRFLRATSLDELPQLINVIKGEMSLIGPRPLLKSYLPLYSPEQARRHEVKPGLTGWAQCNGRNTLSWNQKFKYDVWYVDNVSFKVDCRIFFVTLKKVLKREGINPNDAASTVLFNGKN